MKPNDFEQVINQYYQKRKNALNNLENRKQKLYSKIPRLKEIDDEINKISINKTKSILLNSLTEPLNNNFKNKLFELKKEKEHILKRENVSESSHGVYGYTH